MASWEVETGAGWVLRVAYHDSQPDRFPGFPTSDLTLQLSPLLNPLMSNWKSDP